MYFILSKKKQHPKTGTVHNQLGIVIADTIEQAAEKVGLPIIFSVKSPESATDYVEMTRGYELEPMPEWDGKLEDDKSEAIAEA